MATARHSIVLRSTADRPSPWTLLREGLSEIRSRRRLVRYLVAADLKKKGSDTLLGNLWWILDPLLQMMVYVLLVAVIFQHSQPAYPLFIFAAILPWKWFTSAVNDGVVSVTTQDRLIKQIQFPKLVLPLAATTAGIAGFAFGLIPLAVIMGVAYPDRISAWLLAIPIIAVVQFAFTLAVAFFVAAANVFYRDIGNVARHILRLWFYLSPALYSAEQVQSIVKNHHYIGLLYELNPFATLFESYRSVIYSGQPPDWAGLLALGLGSLLLVAVATVFFKRLEPSFAKVL